MEIDALKIVENNIKKAEQNTPPEKEKMSSEKLQEEIEKFNPPQAIGQNAVSDILAQNLATNFKVDDKKTLNEQAKEIVDVLVVQEVIKDEKVREELKEHKAEEFRSRAEASKKAEQSKSKDEEKNLQKANYGVYEGVASYAGIKRSLPNKMQTILMIPLQIIVGIWLFVCGSATAVINVFLDCTNSIVEKFGQLADNSKKIIKNVAVITIIVGAILGIYFVIRAVLTKYGIWIR